jgi:hypothetical protein
VGDPGDPTDPGRGQVDLWVEAIHRAMDFRHKVGEGRFADVRFDELNADPLATVEAAYGALGLDLDAPGRAAVDEWARLHPPGAHGTHEYALDDFGLDPDGVRERFTSYLERFDVPG